MTSVAFNSTNPVRLFMSNEREVIESLTEGGSLRYDDPLDLTNTLKSFEYHLGDKQTQRMILELINPGTQIEAKLFASYKAAVPRATDPTGAYAGADGLKILDENLNDRVYYVKWGYKMNTDEDAPITAFSHMHRVELINLHYSFSDKKERVFKLELVDSYTKALASDTFLSGPRTFKIPVNAMDQWRSPSEVIQELILQMLLNVEGYLGYSKPSAAMNYVMDKSFQDQLLLASMGYGALQGVKDFDNEVVKLALAQNFTVPDAPYGGAAPADVISPAERFRIYSPTFRERGLLSSYEEQLEGYASYDEVQAIYDMAAANTKGGYEGRAVLAVSQFYQSMGLPLEMPAGYDFGDITHVSGMAVINKRGSPSIPTTFVARNQVGNRFYGPIYAEPISKGGDPYLKAHLEASDATGKSITSTEQPSMREDFTGDPTPFRMDMHPRFFVPSGMTPSSGEYIISSIDFWNTYLGGMGLARHFIGVAGDPQLAVYVAKDPYGGFTAGLTVEDFQTMLRDNRCIIGYHSKANTGGSRDIGTRPSIDVAYSEFVGTDDPNNNIYYPLGIIEAERIKEYIQILSARQEEFAESLSFDPGIDPPPVCVIEDMAVNAYQGALTCGEPVEDLSDIASTNFQPGFADDNWDGALGHHEDNGYDPYMKKYSNRENPHMTPQRYRYNIVCNVRTNALVQTIQKLLEVVNKRFFKNTPQYLQFVKIENTDIPISKRDTFEKVLGVNISNEDWESKDGFLILSTQAFIRQLYSSFDDGRITSFSAIDLTDEEVALDRTISLSVGYERRADNIVTDLQWNYPVTHMLYGLRSTPVGISTVVNIAKRWSVLGTAARLTPRLPTPPPHPPTVAATPRYGPGVAQAIRIAIKQNIEDNDHHHARITGITSPTPSSPTSSPTYPDARYVPRGSRTFYEIKSADITREDEDVTDITLTAGDDVFSESALQAAAAQVLKMDRGDLSGVSLYDSVGTIMSGSALELAQQQLMEDMQMVFSHDLNKVFFPALDEKDTSMVKNKYWLDGMLLNLEVPTFRKINRSPLGTYLEGVDADDIDEVTKELISGRLEWLNNFTKTIINAKISVLGIPEMDLIGDEIFNRNIYVDVHEPRSPGDQHWLTGVYNPRDIVHRVSPREGYIMDMTLVRSGKDNATYMEKLHTVRRLREGGV